LSFLFGDNHSVRRVDAAQILGRQPDSAEMSLNRAVDLWMSANSCKEDPAKCPRPIIIAAAGGASRAGFFTASIIGYLIDTAKEKDPGLNPSAVTKRLFAISGVSGGSVGAAVAAAAMARTKSGEQPCVERQPSLWYGDTIGNWRDCLEALTAGDFLTPVSIGLVFRDIVRFGWWEDRATALERSWEERFSQLVGADIDKWPDQCPGDLRCPFMTVRPQDSHWIPLLVLNGVSSATGRRILTTVLGVTISRATRARLPALWIATKKPRPRRRRLQNLLSAARSWPAPSFWKAPASMICWRTTTRPAYLHAFSDSRSGIMCVTGCRSSRGANSTTYA